MVIGQSVWIEHTRYFNYRKLGISAIIMHNNYTYRYSKPLLHWVGKRHGWISCYPVPASIQLLAINKTSRWTLTVYITLCKGLIASTVSCNEAAWHISYRKMQKDASCTGLEPRNPDAINPSWGYLPSPGKAGSRPIETPRFTLLRADGLVRSGWNVKSMKTGSPVKI